MAKELKKGERVYAKGNACKAKFDLESGAPPMTESELTAEVRQLRFEMELIRAKYPSIFPPKR